MIFDSSFLDLYVGNRSAISETLCIIVGLLVPVGYIAGIVMSLLRDRARTEKQRNTLSISSIVLCVISTIAFIALAVPFGLRVCSDSNNYDSNYEITSSSDSTEVQDAESVASASDSTETQDEELVASASDSTETQNAELVSVDSLHVGDYFAFGSYEQDNDLLNGTEALEWLVLEICDDGSALVISRYALDCVRYHDTYEQVTWETCSLNTWLDEVFIYEAFSEYEQKAIKSAMLENTDNPKYGTAGGNATEDRIFCLSLDEAERYFGNNSDRRTTATDYAQNKGIDNTNFRWWLRSPGQDSGNGAHVNSEGKVGYIGNNVNFYGSAVRPAFYYDPEI